MHIRLHIHLAEKIHPAQTSKLYCPTNLKLIIRVTFFLIFHLVPKWILSYPYPIIFEYANEYADECAKEYANTSHSYNLD